MLADAMAPMPVHPLYCSLRKTAHISLKYEEIGENELMGHPVNAHERALLTVEVLRKNQTEKGRKWMTRHYSFRVNYLLLSPGQSAVGIGVKADILR